MIPTPGKVLNLPLASGRAGTVETVRWMMRLVVEGEAWPGLRPLALSIVDSCGPRMFRCQADKLAEWISEHMRFVNDSWAREQLQTVPYLMRTIAEHGRAYGDCDDYAMLVLAMGKAIGLPGKFRVIRFDMQPNFGHVVPVLFIRGEGWREYDLTIPSGEVPNLPRAEIRDSAVIV